MNYWRATPFRATLLSIAKNKGLLLVLFPIINDQSLSAGSIAGYDSAALTRSRFSSLRGSDAPNVVKTN